MNAHFLFLYLYLLCIVFAKFMVRNSESSRQIDVVVPTMGIQTVMVTQ